MVRRQGRQSSGIVVLNLILLVLLLISLLGLYAVLRHIETGQPLSLWHTEQTSDQPTIGPGNQVLLVEAGPALSERKEAKAARNRVGQVLAQDAQTGHYRVDFGQGQVLDGLQEADLRAIDSPYRLGQDVSLAQQAKQGNWERGQITGMTVIKSKGQISYQYEASFATFGEMAELTDQDFVWEKVLEFQTNYSAEDNNAILRQALAEAGTKSYSRLLFPPGRYAIGSQIPNQDYQLLVSNLTLQGQETTLVVDGSARWFGLATGPTATDGLSNFAMQDLAIEAKDLSKGNQFILMANHGTNWQVANNRFTLVHQLSSHIFDLGGVQEVTFEGNIFEGYAPELTTVTTLGERSVHNAISEAIQFDASSNNGEWDGGLLKAIDPDYQAHNPVPILSHNIRVINNAFLPYRSEEGDLVAYGASIGQHSSGVGHVTITGNWFQETLSRRFKEQASPAEQWLFDPIHLISTAPNVITDNVVE